MAFETRALLVRMPLSLHQWVFTIAERTGESAASIIRTALRSELFRREEELENQKGHTDADRGTYEAILMNDLAATRVYLDNEEAGNRLGLCTRENPCCEEPQVINLRKYQVRACTCLCHE